MKPEQGKVYVSETDPKLRIYIEAVHDIEADEDEPATFHVEACYEKDRDNPGGWGIEFAGYEWDAFSAEHKLIASH